MSGFDADWLALREPADRAARSPRLVAMAAKLLARHPDPHVCDLGSGTGAAVRAFGPAFPGATRWTLVDDSADVLAEARRLCGEGVETRRADLAAQPRAWGDDCALVTATALLDLAAPAWIEALVAALAETRTPFLVTLTYDGEMSFSPGHPLDADVTAAVNAHQRRDKGLGGPASGPDAPTVLGGALARHGYAVEVDPTPWRLERTAHGPLIEAMVTGLARAAAETGEIPDGPLEDWRDDRLRRLVRMTVGHRDCFAWDRLSGSA